MKDEHTLFDRYKQNPPPLNHYVSKRPLSHKQHYPFLLHPPNLKM